jgi:hypothetical protein
MAKVAASVSRTIAPRRTPCVSRNRVSTAQTRDHGARLSRLGKIGHRAKPCDGQG